ncbi:MAG: hypothetical protein IT514_15725 [Burkholderiales bacterium]|nr:hypothetical protein [Burkholderiales bacterium]
MQSKELVKNLSNIIKGVEWRRADEDDTALVKLHKDKEAGRTLYLIMERHASLFSGDVKWAAWLGWAEPDDTDPTTQELADETEHSTPIAAFQAVLGHLEILHNARELVGAPLARGRAGEAPPTGE